MDQPESTEKQSSGRLMKSGVVVSAMTMLSRVLGLVRDNVLFRYLGDGADADVFFIAFKIPNFLRRLFAEGAFAQAFVPVLAEYREQGSRAAAKEFIDRVAGCLGSSLLLVTVLMVVGSPVVAMIFAPGFWDNPYKMGLTADFIRLTAPYLFLISMTGFAGATLNSYGNFAVPAFTPVLLNLVLIGSAVLVSPLMDPPALALAWGVLVAGLVQWLFQLPFLARIRLLARPKLDWKHPGVKKVLKLMVPALFGVSVSQINLTIDTILASFLPTGSVSWLYFSDRLSELPLGIIGIALATVVLPSLSRFSSASEPDRFSTTLDWAVRIVLVLGVPAAAALFVLAGPILFTLFQYDQATVQAITMSSYSLKAYSLGVLAFMLIKVLATGFFSRQDMKTPVKIGVIAMVSNIVFNLVFVLLLIDRGLGHVGLAFATSLSAYINAGLLFVTLYRQGIYRFTPGWWRFVLALLVANIAMVAVLLLLTRLWSGWVAWGWFERGLYLGIIIAAGLGTYLAGLFISGLRGRDFRSPL